MMLTNFSTHLAVNTVSQPRTPELGNKNDEGKPKYSERNASQCHFDHQKSYTDWSGIEPSLQGARVTTAACATTQLIL